MARRGRGNGGCCRAGWTVGGAGRLGAGGGGGVRPRHDHRGRRGDGDRGQRRLGVGHPDNDGAGLVTPRETPQSVSVVTQQAIIDQNAQTLTEVLDFTTGVTAIQGNGEVRFGYFARGSEIVNMQIDGLASWMHWYMRDINPQVFDRVEVVRGATGLIEGAGNPSASVNLIRKRGTGERRGSRAC